uniref:ABC transporter, periplasmic solute-binding protein n=1 Tax=Cyanothece sp. (strain PCC 7425 / ATCC 29141) TaxID=395961 RepID=B8HWR4_CYAP4
MVADRRIISLIPSATEIVAALGLTDCLVGRSHECDYPAVVTQLPVCTAPNLDPQGSSQEIHDRVTALLQNALSIYRVDLHQLEALQPTHILTQAQCEVCAVSLAQVEDAVRQLTQSQPQLISLQPATLDQVWEDIDRVARALGVESQPTLQALQSRVNYCQRQTAALRERPTVACIEWTEPLMAAGNWVPQLVELAGGQDLLGTIGQHSVWSDWSTLLEANPEVIIFMPCGFDLEQTRQAAMALTQHPGWTSLQAAQTERVYLTDGNQYFNRPGPRLVDSLEILAEILHPSQFRFGYEGGGWQRWSDVV